MPLSPLPWSDHSISCFEDCFAIYKRRYRQFKIVIQKWSSHTPINGLSEFFEAVKSSDPENNWFNTTSYTNEKPEHYDIAKETWDWSVISPSFFVDSQKDYCFLDFFRRGTGQDEDELIDHQKIHRIIDTISVEEYDKLVKPKVDRFKESIGIDPDDKVKYYWNWPAEYMTLPVYKAYIQPFEETEAKYFYFVNPGELVSFPQKYEPELGDCRNIIIPSNFRTYNDQLLSEIYNSKSLFEKIETLEANHHENARIPEFFYEASQGHHTLMNRIILIHNKTKNEWIFWGVTLFGGPGRGTVKDYIDIAVYMFEDEYWSSGYQPKTQERETK